MIMASVSLSVSRTKTVERIDVLSGVETPEDPKNIVLDGVPHPRGQVERRFDAVFAILL